MTKNVAHTFKFEAEKPYRLKRYFMGVVVTDLKDNLWWNHTLGCWETLGSSAGCSYGTMAPCRTLAAFKRMLRKNPEIQGRCSLVNRYIGYDVESIL